MSEAACEMLETFDEARRPVGRCQRNVIHTSGLWHRSVNVILFAPDGRMILQRRSRLKDVCPLVWDLSVAEHLKPGESFLEAANRGLEEELSLDGVRLVPFGSELEHRYAPTGSETKDYEIQRLFLGSSDCDPRCDRDEIVATRYASLAEMMMIMANSAETLTPWFRAWLDILARSGLNFSTWLTSGHF